MCYLTEQEEEIGSGIARMLSEHRKRQGVSLEELADRMQLAPETVDELERGVQPITASRLLLWLIALDIPPNKFLSVHEQD